MDLKCQLGVSYNTAWMVQHKLIQAMREREDSQPLRGIVELDEAYLGGEASGAKRGRGAACKTPFGAAAQVSDDGCPERLRLSPGGGFRRRAVAAWARQPAAARDGGTFGWAALLQGSRQPVASTSRAPPAAAKAVASRLD